MDCITEAIGNMKRELSVEWVIPNFSLLSEEDSKCYCSNKFFFNDEPWYLKIYPNGDRAYSTLGFVDLILVRLSSHPEISLDFSLCIKNASGKKEVEKPVDHIFDKNDEEGCSLLSRKELLKRKSELLPDDSLTVVCTIKYPEVIENTYDKCVCKDFKEMLLDGLNHDLILKVGDKELRAHQDVLRARSHVFKSMLSHDMKEKSSGIIDIPDCDAQAMELFLSYIYCGKVGTMEESNVSNLYYIADKYDMKELKEECSEFMKKSLSFANICKAIQLALNHTDFNLLNNCTEYFANNMLGIMHTLEWQSFLKDNPTAANELLIKCIKKKIN